MQALLNERDVSALIKLSIRTLQRLRYVGGGPRFVRLHGSVRYRLTDLEAWIASRVVSSTSQTLKRDQP
jgi:predicted DNA-binding transcriptional regulator AlpA